MVEADIKNISMIREKIREEIEEDLYGEEVICRVRVEKIDNAVHQLYNNALRIIRGECGIINPNITIEQTKEILEEIYEILIKNSSTQEKEYEIEDVLKSYMVDISKIYKSNYMNDKEYIKISMVLEGMA